MKKRERERERFSSSNGSSPQSLSHLTSPHLYNFFFFLDEKLQQLPELNQPSTNVAFPFGHWCANNEHDEELKSRARVEWVNEQRSDDGGYHNQSEAIACVHVSDLAGHQLVSYDGDDDDGVDDEKFDA